MDILSIASICFVVIGMFFFVAGTIGILRMPDVYTRMHMSGLIDTLGSLALLFGLALLNLKSFTLPDVLVSIKIMLIMGFVFLANPTATHAFIDSGMRAGLRPWLQPSASPAGTASEENPS